MKKYWMIGLVLVIILVGAVSFAVAQSDDPAMATTGVRDTAVANPAPITQDNQPTVPAGGNFVDENGDGICDNCGATQPQGSMNGNQFGAANQSNNFVDADGDGVCDNCGTNEPLAAQDGTGNRYGANGLRGNGQAHAYSGTNFVDADGDGICDTCGTTSGSGSNFVDADGDGVCDTCGTASPQQLGQGNRYGQSGDRGMGGGFGHNGNNGQP